MTTGDVASLLSVSISTVVKWCDRGLLQCRKIPGSRHRRIDDAEVLRFARKWGMPTEEIERRMK